MQMRITWAALAVFLVFATGAPAADRAEVNEDLSIRIPAVYYGDTRYHALLGYYENETEPGIYWRLEESGPGPTPVYVSVVLHYEDSFDFRDEAAYRRNRSDLLNLATLLSRNGIAMNVQPDWAFMLAMDAFESIADLAQATGGKNILVYLTEALGHEVDPHSHEKQGYNMADVACMLAAHGIDPGDIVGGLIVDPPEDSVYAQYLSPMASNRCSGYFWNGKWLWGDATGLHTNDTPASGIWRPKNAENYYVHDENAPLLAIGKYRNTIDGVYDLVAKLDKGEAPPGKIYTAAIFVGQGNVPQSTVMFKNEMATLKALEAEGKIVFVSLDHLKVIWKRDFAGQPNLYIPPD